MAYPVEMISALIGGYLSPTDTKYYCFDWNLAADLIWKNNPDSVWVNLHGDSCSSQILKDRELILENSQFTSYWAKPYLVIYKNHQKVGEFPCYTTQKTRPDNSNSIDPQFVMKML